MTKTNINDTTVVKVACGNRIGTAFFVTSELLLTARHNVTHSKTDDESIYILLGETSYSAEIVYEDIICNGDICILRINAYTTPLHLICLNMPIRKGDRYSFMGYPLTTLGQVAGSIVDVEIHNKRDNFHITEGFDCTATIIGRFIPTEFSGFSGSPIYNDEGLVIGVITHKLDGCVGFVSIAKISDLLTQHDILFESDYTKYDKSPYSKLTNRKKIEKAINMAGPRYMRDIHVPTNSFDKYFEYAIKTSVIDKRLAEYKESFVKIQDLIEHTSLLIFKSDDVDFKDDLLESIKVFDISSNNSYMNYWMDILNDNLNNLKKIKGKNTVSNKDIYEFSAMWDSFYTTHNDIKDDASEYLSLRNNPYICITGGAGSGKTHLLCHIAEQYTQTTNVFLCFGSQFDAQREIEEQLQQILELENKTYLQDLNDISQENRTVIIIDAMNEGVGYHLWQSKLTPFLSVIKKHPNICLILSVRDPFVNSLGLSDDFTLVKHNGHSNIQCAKEIYFNHYKINRDEISFKTPEFRNPLFLKIFCETYSQLNPYQKKDINKLWSLFGAYVKNKEILISDKIDFDHHLRPIRQFIDNIASRLLKPSKEEFRLKDISRNDAHVISNKIIPNRTWSKSLLYWMLEEDLLISSIRHNQPLEEMDRIDFAYERMGDIFKVITFLRLQQKEQTQILNKIIKSKEAQAYNFLVALSSIIPDWDDQKKEIFDVFSSQFNSSWVLKEAYMNSLDYRSIESEKVIDILSNKIFRTIEDKTFFIPFFNNVHKEDTKLNAKSLHKILSELSFAELNQRWTNTINTLYKERKIELYYSIEEIQSIKTQPIEERYNYLVFLCWLLSSSYPVVRDRVTRIITHILNANTSLTIKLIEQFKDVQDLYVLERLICAVYGTVLLSEDNSYIRDVANTVLSSIFKDRTAPPHIHLRHYARLIVERAYYLKLVNETGYRLSLPPYNSDISVITILDDENIIKLGTSNGTQLMLYSIGLTGDGTHVSSDFYRYILGGNSRTHSVFSKINRNGATKMINKDEYFTVNEFAKIICNEVKLMGWNDELGKLDNGEYSYNRHENKKERIGKKFQWLGLYSAIAKLADNNYLNSYWERDLIEYDNPFDISYGDYFDPTLKIPELDNTTDIEKYLMIKKQSFIPEESYEDWIKSENDKLVVQNFIPKDINGDDWVRVSGIDTWSANNDGIKKELFYRYDTYFIDSDKLSQFTKWGKVQNFYGRWMPEKRDYIRFRLYEYIWCSTYVKEKIEWSENPGGGCPCEVTTTTLTHLQENYTGLMDDENRSHTTALPCEDLFLKMNLHMSKQRGVILDDTNAPAVIDVNNIDNSSNGLYIRKNILDKYLSMNKKSLVACVLGGKEMISGMQMINNMDISGFYHYDSKKGYIGDLHIIDNPNEKK